ncbi:hypothetical protein HHL17_01140 [Chitinophaga sp. G-6-1-13]|uniref:Uncharacterized protein n=1 Tax=Chitinophaga fulva TaxID=2728842 RepID=A0A848GIU2_9BACT|nr:hypothetical protein [Chitinophaga fulva]NML35788.1 hypothetical protein [Chitinophaga fulva]
MRYSNGLYLSVPTPCGENWDKMTNTAAGKHCDSCAKTVIDFSFMTDAEIFAVINNSKGNVCGRFQNQQLDRLINPPAPPRKNFLPALLLTAGLITGIANHSYAEARDLEQVEMAISPQSPVPLVPEDTVAKPNKAHTLPELVVVSSKSARTMGVVVPKASSILGKDPNRSCGKADSVTVRPPMMIEPVRTVDQERRQVKKKKRWF